MVLKGQFLERMTTVMSGPLQLEALFHEGTRGPPCVVACPHPAYGGSMDTPVCAELAWAITRRKFSTLRFNYRGIGASQGKGHTTSPTADEERADLHAAIQLMRTTGNTERVNVAGYSFGAWLASHIALEQPRVIDRLVLVAPPTHAMPFDFDALSRSGIETAIIIGTRDTHADVGWLEKECDRPNLSLHRVPDGDHFFLRGLALVGTLAAQHLDVDTRADAEAEEANNLPPLELDLEPRGD